MDTKHKAVLRLNSTITLQDIYLGDNEEIKGFMERHFAVDLGPRNPAKGDPFPFDQRRRHWLGDHFGSEPDIDTVPVKVGFFDGTIDIYGEKHHTEIIQAGYYDIAPDQLAQLVIAHPHLLDNGQKLCVGTVFSPYGNDGQFVIVYKDGHTRHLKVVSQSEVSQMGQVTIVAQKL